MKTNTPEKGSLQPHLITLACALAVAGLLFGAVSGLAGVLLPTPGGDGGWPTNTPLATWSFSDNTNWTSDQGYSPISFTNLANSYLGNSASLVIDTNVPAWLQYYVYEPTNGATNLTVNAGSVTFWFAPDWSSTNGGLGQWAQLLDVGEWTSNSSYGYWGLSVDPAGSNLWFVSQDGAGNTHGLSTPISWTTNYFHFVALTYSSTNVSLYLDGQLATNDPGGLSIWPDSEVLSNGFYVGSDYSGVYQAHGLFNSLYTYNYPLDSNTVQQIYGYEYGWYMINPLNYAMANVSFSSATNSYPSYSSTFNVITGPGELQWNGAASTCSYGTDAYDVWITNVMARAAGNGTMNITFTIEGGADGVPYDVFANSVLSFGTNGVPWAWMGQGYHCNTYTITNLQSSFCFLILGTPKDTGGYGLTDAYELLVDKINPNGPQTDGYGVPYAWYAEFGLGTQSATQDPDHDGLLNYQEYFYGTRPNVSEGFSIWTATGTTDIP